MGMTSQYILGSNDAKTLSPLRKAMERRMVESHDTPFDPSQTSADTNGGVEVVVRPSSQSTTTSLVLNGYSLS